MTICRTRWTVWCDEPSARCGSVLNVDNDNWEVVVRTARSKGWKISDKRGSDSDDRCPDCLRGLAIAQGIADRLHREPGS